jgi:hypothetical protein
MSDRLTILPSEYSSPTKHGHATDTLNWLRSAWKWTCTKAHPSNLLPHYCKARKQASSNEIANANRCTTHQLPPELLQNIASFLDGPDLLAFSFACRWFTAALWRTHYIRDTSSNDRAVFRAKFKRDTYQKAAAKQDLGPAPKRKLLCSYCMEAHPIAAFTDQEKIKSAVDRECFGVQGQFRACEHRSYTLQELRGLTDADAGFSCQEYKANSPGNSCLSHTCKINTKVFNIRTIFCMYIPQHGVLSWPVLQKRLDDLCQCICPHMRTNDTSFQRRLLHNRRNYSPINYNSVLVGRSTSVFSPAGVSTSASVQCNDKHCDTRATLYKHSIVGQINLEIFRSTGDLRSASDPRWCAQLESQPQSRAATN